VGGTIERQSNRRFPMFATVFFAVWSVSILAIGVAYHRYNAQENAQ
jgi:hypothetical protein